MDLIMILFRSWTLGPLGRLPHVATKNPPRSGLQTGESNKKHGFQMCAVLHLLLLRLFFLHLLEIVLLCWEILRDSSLPGWENCECMIATENHPSIWTPSKHVVNEILLPRGTFHRYSELDSKKQPLTIQNRWTPPHFWQHLQLMAVPTVQQSCCICIPAAILARASSSAWAVAKSWIFALKVKDVSSIKKYSALPLPRDATPMPNTLWSIKSLPWILPHFATSFGSLFQTFMGAPRWWLNVLELVGAQNCYSDDLNLKTSFTNLAKSEI